jgi:septation ring formation regulator EzrA
VLDLLNQVKNEVNGRFDKLETKNETLLGKISDIDRTYVTRVELQESLRQVGDEFSKAISKIEGVFTAMADDSVPRSEYELRMSSIDKKFAEMEEEFQSKKNKVSAVKLMLLSASVSAVFAFIVQYVSSLVKH